ncbi:putative quinol monooxygenase [Ectopseudomonas khazarica]|uniref:putative quinol monooxygenase n=1 Tax=Ectopseudomonas khazarica TaxID=2502979 RepID=UPI0006467CA9
MLSETIAIVVHMTAKTGREEELGHHLIRMIEPTTAEDGCINYNLHRDSVDPATWVLYETWRSKKDLDKHMTSSHFLDFQSIQDEMLAKDMRVEVLTPIKTTQR